MKQKFSKKFKQHAIEQVLNRNPHETIQDIALKLKLSVFTLKTWLRLYRREITAPVIPTSSEIEMLRAEIVRKDKLIIELTALLVANKSCI
jgi:transposase-like protein